jgi:predicted RNA methylase
MIAAAKLRAGLPIGDDVFDQVYPPNLRALSSQHWTPVEVAARAAQLFEARGVRNVVDIGAGPGKFCIVGALTSQARFTGIERRLSLVQEAREAAVALGAERAGFVHGNVCEVDLSPFDGIYLFNPFCEQICETLPAIDDDAEFSPLIYRYYVMATMAHFERATPGTVVMTYFGYGGRMPEGYRCVHIEAAGEDKLRVWIKDAGNS